MAKRRVTKRRRATGAEQSAPEPTVETGNDASDGVSEDSYAVFHWPGPGMYTGSMVSSRGIPRHATVSLPPDSFKEALSDGLEFVRWAGIDGPSLEL